MADATLFEETFNITSLNQDNKYDRVQRIFGTTREGDMEMTLDINNELYPIKPGETINMVIASSLDLEGKKEDKGWMEIKRSGEQTLADLYEYVMRGRIYRLEEGESDMIKVYVSFGGLLLYLQGPFKKLTSMRIEYVYLLIKK